MGFKFLELFLRRTFDSYGHWVGRRPTPFLVVPLLVNACLAVGLTYFNMDSDVGRLFTPHNSGSLRELQMLRQFSRTDGASPQKTSASRRNGTGKISTIGTTTSQNDDNATAAVASSLFEKTKSLQYLWYDVQLMHWQEKDILQHRPWNDIIELVRMIYENYTCTIKDPRSKENRQYTFIPDFCRPEIGCSRADENLVKIDKLLDISRKNPNDPNVRLTYPVMQIYGTSVNWGEFLQGVTVDSTTNKVTEAKLLIVPLQFQFDAKRQTLSTVHECMRQLSAFYSNLGTYDQTVNVYTAYEQMFIDEVVRTQEYILPYVCVTVILVAIFCVLTTAERDGSCKLVGSLLGLVTIGLSLCSGFGLMFYVGMSYNFMVSVTPFIVMCVGIDNDFLLMAAWRQTDPGKESRVRLGESLMEAGPSLTITSATDILCFLIGCISGTPAVSSFCLFTAISLSFRYVYQMTFYAAIMIFEGRCDQKHFNRKNLTTVSIEKKFSKHLPCKSICELVNRRCHSSSSTTVPRSEYFMHKFFRVYWARFLMLKYVRVGGACLLVAYVVFSLSKARLFSVNITPERVITDDSPMVKIFQNAEKYYWPYNAVGHIFVLSPPDFRNSTNRRRMSDFIDKIEDTAYFTTSSRVGTTVWFRDYLNYLNFLISADSGDEYWPEFYQQLEPFLMTGDNSKFISDIYFRGDNLAEGEPNIEKFQFRSFFQNVTTWNDHVELMLHWRKACAEFPEFNALVADHSSLNPYLDQRLSLSPTTLQTMGVALLSMTVVTGLFMPDVIGIFYITLSFISVDVGVIGFLQVWNCDLDPATLTGIVMTIGFSVYYTARVCYNYQCADKNLDAEAKMRCTMGAVGWPVLQGGLGTIVGILPLSLIKTYIARTFFKTIVLVVCAGLLHGLLFMPILLVSLDSSMQKRLSRAKKNRRLIYSDSSESP